MCEHCGTDGACICCGYDQPEPLTPENAGTRFRPGLVDRVAMLRLELSRLQTEAQEIEAELLREMRRQGRRPADGSDQPALFETDATPSMF